MPQDAFEKEAFLKDMVEKLLKDRDLSDFTKLDSLFEEIKNDLEHQKNSK